MKLVFFDTETTGIGYKDRIVQLYYQTYDGSIKKNIIVNPGIKISPGASKVHGIFDKDVQNHLKFCERKDVISEINEVFKTNVAIAHNATFDINMVKKEGVINPVWVIDTLCIAREYYNFKNNKLGNIGTELGLNDGEILHTADGDVALLQKIFEKFLGDLKKSNGWSDSQAVQHMIDVSSGKTVLTKMPFGKHKGKEFSVIPKDYLDWLIEKKQAEWIQSTKDGEELSGFDLQLKLALEKCVGRKIL